MAFENVMRHWLVAFALASAVPHWAFGQGGVSVDVFTEISPGLAIIEVKDATVPPVWCDDSTIAFQREQINGGRRWIEYYDLLNRQATVEEISPDAGGLLACTPRGKERLMRRGFSDALILVQSGNGQEIEVSSTAVAVSVDRWLRNYIYRGVPAAGRTRPSTYTVSLGSPNQWPDSADVRPRLVRGVPPQLWQAAAMQRDGKYAAYLVGTDVPLDLQPAIASLDLVVTRLDSGRSSTSHLTALIGNAARFDSLLFNDDRLLIVAETEDGRLTFAICVIGVDIAVLCRERTLNINARKFEVIGLGEAGPIAASRPGQVGGEGLRACLFEVRSREVPIPDACRIDFASRVPGFYSAGIERHFVISPDRSHIAVFTRYRPQENSAPSTPSWIVLPISAFQK
jgi:hypothetical protein